MSRQHACGQSALPRQTGPATLNTETNQAMKPYPNLMRQIQRLGAFAVLLGLAAGCASSRVDISSPRATTTTAVALTGKNYRLIKPAARGRSYGFKLLGIIPLAGPTAASARQRLYASVTEPLAGKAVAIANQMEDRSNLYLILFSIPKLTITADVIEFVDEGEK